MAEEQNQVDAAGIYQALADRVERWLEKHGQKQRSSFSYADMMLISGALDCTVGLLENGDELGRDRLALLRAQAVFRKTLNPRAAGKELGWTRKRGQQHDPDEVLGIYECLISGRDGDPLVGQLLLIGKDLTDQLITTDAPPVLSGPGKSLKVDTPQTPEEAVATTAQFFGFNSVDSCWQLLNRENKARGLQLALPPRRSLKAERSKVTAER